MGIPLQREENAGLSQRIGDGPLRKLRRQCPEPLPCGIGCRVARGGFPSWPASGGIPALPFSSLHQRRSVFGRKYQVLCDAAVPFPTRRLPSSHDLQRIDDQALRLDDPPATLGLCVIEGPCRSRHLDGSARACQRPGLEELSALEPRWRPYLPLREMKLESATYRAAHSWMAGDKVIS